MLSISMISQLIAGGGVEERLAQVQPGPTGITLAARDKKLTLGQVRAFQKQISFLPTDRAGERHFILEAQNLTLPAQQALLKILEEPPVGVQIILTTDRIGSLLPTIISRCQVVHLQAPPTADPIPAKALLQKIGTGNYADLIHLAQDLATSADNETQLNQLLRLLRSSLVQKPTPRRAAAIAAVNQTLSDLKTTINRQLALEHLFFYLKSL